MTNRIQQLFQQKKDILSVYFTAGYPTLNDTVRILQALEKSGVDLVEIGMPFSDPLADGPTIQASSLVALNNGMTIKVLFEQLVHIRKSVTIPLVLMGYVNPVHKYGIEAFIAKCAEVGVDGVIIPDLPFNEYLDDYKPTFDGAGVANINLITPQTPESRIRLIDENTNSFIYMVSSAAVTGAKKGLAPEQIAYFERINAMKLKNPTLIGFGISDRESFLQTCKHASGAIVGSAFVKMIGESPNLESDIETFVNNIKRG
ncbi:tryptophan synthase alpha chain [Breznakibacter xylanolyticus]|uniref:Tryptophan synthase alpha chain n=1 Tax=Breznakibacter xylanolyticus TaxID=990 RepID=A0A2W7NCQ2_9BACT|nr:tryptophan synthase subunit alpha [Breznakibacter xylanolyticus]PZX17403.1 tryptophan synthase alpha chain [Breznakibacter xylanolyticus]